MADAAIIATQDKDHYALAIEAINKGYHLLLEKPAAPTPEECLAIEKAAISKGVMVVICHVLRYTPFFKLIKKVIDEGRLGKIMNLEHTEGVGDLHYSHSYVRGDWHKTADSTPMILSKSSHDIDIIQWLMDEPCTKVQSFGALKYFCVENKPVGAPEFCYQGCPHEAECPYSAVKLYRERQVPWFARHAAKNPNPTEADIEKLITETSYGRCVFQGDNDVVDHQVVNMNFKNGATAVFTLAGCSKFGDRRTTVFGSRGELFGDGDKLFYYNYLNGETRNIEIPPWISTDRHGGGDYNLLESFAKAIAENDPSYIVTGADVSLKTHTEVFAAEKSRLEKRMIHLEEMMG